MTSDNIEISTKAELSGKLYKEWEDLWENSRTAHVFNSPSWLKTFIGNHTEIRLITAKKDNMLMGIIPLIRDRVGGVETWTDPGNIYSRKSSSLTLDDDLVKKLLIKNLMKLNEFYLHEIDAHYANIFKNTPGIKVEEVSTNPVLLIDKDPLAYMRNGQNNRLIKKYKELADNLELKSYVGDKRALNRVIKLDRESAKSLNGINFFRREANIQAAEKMLANLRNIFRIDILYFKNEPVIYSIGFAYKKTYYAFATSYKAEFSNIMPDKLLMKMLLNDLQQSGFEIFDFSTGLNSFKKDFTPFFNKQYAVFYSRNPLVMDWWSLIIHTSHFLKSRSNFYNFYCKTRSLARI